MQSQALLVEYKTRQGKSYCVDISDQACERYGLYNGDILEDKQGSTIKIVGVYDRQLYCLKDNDDGISYWDDVECYQDFISKGYTLRIKNKVKDTLHKINNENVDFENNVENTLVSINDNRLNVNNVSDTSEEDIKDDELSNLNLLKIELKVEI